MEIFIPKYSVSFISWLRQMHLKNVEITARYSKKYKRKKCGIIYLNVPNFLYIHEKSYFKRENSKKPIIIRF